ncbi:hypothetical protein ACFWMS_25380 [Peribacillus butanolivorans]|uniref:hypothetical protein n=1 Tax=Peribacillus butanolivorans TaxID=421767 RepID=UPI003646348B
MNSDNDLNKMVELVNAMEAALNEFSCSNDFLDTFDGYDIGNRCMETKWNVHEEAYNQLKPLVELLEENDYMRTEDTGRFLTDEEGAFYNEIEGTWWDSKISMIKNCFEFGMTKEEIREGLYDDETNPDGTMFWTTWQVGA